jgi:hypothetical protein
VENNLYLLEPSTPKPSTPKPNKRQWPELVGKKGEDAVKIIKKETGRFVIIHK